MVPRLHAVMLPLPLQGHVNPAVHLAIKLASMGFTITFVNTQFIDHQINNSKVDGADMFAGVRQSGLDIRYTVVSDGSPLSSDRTANNEKFWADFELSFPSHLDQLLASMVCSEIDPPLNCIIADTFFYYCSNIAAKYKLVHVSLWTESATVYSVYYHMNLLSKNGHLGSNDGMLEDTITYIPGVPAIRFKDLPSYIQDNDDTDVIFGTVKKSFQIARGAEFVLFNTTQELESEAISTLQHEQPVYAVGPIFPSQEFSKTMVPSSLLFESDCVRWLNTKPPGSVLYVSFGSLFSVGKAEIVELAYALLYTKVNFVWVLPPHAVGSEVRNVLPTGYEEDTKERGLVVQWCNQVEVISHDAVGGFLSHGGWNSTLESIWFGVPLLCFPIYADQITNRKLIVDDWKIGLNLCQSKSITREEAARNTNCLMTGATADELRGNVSKLRKTLQNAIAAGGSADKNLFRFVNNLKAKLTQNWTVLKQYEL